MKPWVFLATFAGSIAYYSKTSDAFLLTALSRLYGIGGIYGIRMLLASAITAYAPVFALRSFLWLFYFRYKRYVYENPKKPSLLTKFWAVSSAIVPNFLRICLKI